MTLFTPQKRLRLLSEKIANGGGDPPSAVVAMDNRMDWQPWKSPSVVWPIDKGMVNYNSQHAMLRH